MDYNFISVGEFRVLEESGLLLESGTYDGMCRIQHHFYITVDGDVKTPCYSEVDPEPV